MPHTVNEPGLGTDPGSLIAQSEAASAGIRPGAEKQIVWAHGDHRRTALSIVYVHGFSASAGEIRPVPDRIAEKMAANLFYTRLAGHGMDGQALARASLADWQDDLRQAIKIGAMLGERIILIGTSTGGALVTWALAQPSLARNVAAAVLLSPNYRLKAAGAFLLEAPFARQMVHLALGRTRHAEAATDLQRRIWTAHYPTDALLPMAQTVRLARRTKVEAIRTPALFLYSPADRIVDPERTLQVARRWGGPHQEMALARTGDPNNHVLAGDAYSPDTSDLLVTEISTWLIRTACPNS